MVGILIASTTKRSYFCAMKGSSILPLITQKPLGICILYIHKGHTDLIEGQRLARTLSLKLGQKMPLEWRVFPNIDLPRDFNILIVPYEVYAKERGASWARHM